jgi:cellulose synthase/poly-beta-1,6-N-acetylglucosamine synthase-like glycosyltransferase
MYSSSGRQVVAIPKESNDMTPESLPSAVDLVSRIKVRDVAIILPARNEAEQIGATLNALFEQTKLPRRIIVVVNNCTDGDATAAKARSFRDVEVVEMTNNPFLKAGALNEGVRFLVASKELPEFILTMDADTIPDEDFLENTVNVLNSRPEVGGVSTVCDGKKKLGKTRFAKALALVQQLEYARAGFTRLRVNIHTMSGAGSMLRMKAVLDVLDSRGVLFAERTDNLVEDFETTLEVKRMGWKCISNYYCHVQTDLMTTIPELMKQRVRWVHGTINELRRRGWSKETWQSILTMWYAYISIPVYYLWVLLLGVQMTLGKPVLWGFWFLGFVMIFQALSVYRLGWKMMLLAALLLPELLFAVIRHAWIIVSLVKSYSMRRYPRSAVRTKLSW